MSRLRQIKQPESSLPTITLTPLIDTVLVLLIIFMVTTPSKKIFIREHVKGDKDKTDFKDENYRVALLTIDKSGDIFLNNKSIKKENLIKDINIALEKSPIRTVFVKADPLTKRNLVHDLIDKLRSIDQIRILFVGN